MSLEENTLVGSYWDFSNFSRTFVRILLLILILSAFINIIVDPYAIYGTGLFPDVESDYNLIKLNLFKNFNPPPEALILGSSRCITMDPEIVEDLTGKRCFNFSVPSAKTETIYAIAKLVLDDYNCPVDTIILGLDPESFHPTMKTEQDVRYIPEIARNFIYDSHPVATVADKIYVLFSFDQLTESFASLHKYILQLSGPRKFDFRDDGYGSWRQLDEKIQNGTFDLQKRLTGRIDTYSERSLQLLEYDSLGETRKKYWNAFIDLCKQHGVFLYVFFPVEHPQLHENLKAKCAEEIFDVVRDYITGTIDENGWVFKDYRDCLKAGLSPDAFYDEIHIQPSNSRKILVDLLSGSNARESTGN